MAEKALIIIDVQNDMFQKGNTVHNGQNLLNGLSSLIDKAREKSIPVIYIQHNEPEGYPLESGTIGWEIHVEIQPQVGDLIIQKTKPDSFYKTNLEEELLKRGVQHLYLTGIQTEVCVDTTCRRAYSKEFNVTLVADLHSTWSSRDLSAQQIINHHNGTLQWFADVVPSVEVNF